MRTALADAIRKAYTCETQLFEEQANERSVLFHVGRYLATEVETWDADLTVDLEYNRHHLPASSIRNPKRLPQRAGSVSLVYPDLIVHNRSGSTTDHNLLVLEAKHNPSPEGRDRDYRKLQAFRQYFHYRHAVFLELPPGGAKPLWQWFTDQNIDSRRLRLFPVF